MIKLFTYKGIPTYITYWFFLLFFLLDPIKIPIIFLSILIHEYAHGLVAKKLGYKTEYIYIGLFSGGAAVDIKILNDPISSIKMVIAGPISNLIIALIALSIYNTTNYSFSGEIFYVFVLNILLYIINFIPIFPLDGGRITYAIFLMSNSVSEAKIKNKKVSKFFKILIALIIVIYFLINFIK